MVARQLRYSAGTWLELGRTQLLLDPGPGTLLRARRARPPLAPEKLSAILLSHKHLDHAADVNVLVEALTEGGRHRRGALLAPSDALEGEDPVVLRYLRGYLNRIETWQEDRDVTVGDIAVRPIRHHHSVDTFGLVLTTPEGRIGFVVDGRMTAGLAQRYAGCALLVINTVLRDWNPDIDHLSFPEALQIVQEVRPKLAVLTHFGMTMLRAGPRKLAQKATDQLGLPVVAATDGLTLHDDAWRDSGADATDTQIPT